jgi:hypothetical protein
MEKIRIISKNDVNQVIGDRVLFVDGVKLNPIDRPAFVELRDGQPRKMVFAYPNSKEKVGRVTSANGHFAIEYGRISGRIKSVVPQLSSMSGTDRYELSRAILAIGSGTRFKHNVETQMTLVEKLLPQL